MSYSTHVGATLGLIDELRQRGATRVTVTVCDVTASADFPPAPYEGDMNDQHETVATPSRSPRPRLVPRVSKSDSP